MSSPRLRPGSTLGFGLGAFFVSRLPLSLLPMKANITQIAWQSEMLSPRRTSQGPANKQIPDKDSSR
jgi:hypothetical protein